MNEIFFLKRLSGIASYRQSFMRYLVYVFLPFFISGCLPFPHIETRLPKVSGLLLKDDSPLSKAEVRITELWKDSFCEKPERLTFTDDKGRFEIPAVNTFRLFKPILGDPLFGWNLCIVVEGKTYIGSARGGVGFSPPSIVLRCTLKSVYTDVEAAEVNKFGLCTTTAT